MTMAREVLQALFIEQTHHYSLVEVVHLSGLAAADVAALVERGALEPEDPRASPLSFAAHAVELARRARALRDAFALDDLDAVAVLLRFDERMRELERELAALRARSGLRR
jgi:chaperone modulatory protein CbpM